ncbi:MAG: class I SAM-dependent methyltransferase [Gemmatimonadota bacterium]
MSDEFWEDPERVERFAERDPDHRLVALVEEYGDPGAVRVLDLGCAGGRNTVFLAERGFDVWALDASAAMVERTRDRLAGLMGEEEVRRRVRRRRMDDLSEYPDHRFDLVVSLGVQHSARTWAEWERAAAETARVLVPGGRLLFTQFTPDVDLTGEGVTSVPGEPHVYTGFPAGRAVLVDAETLDRELATRGLRPEVPSETVRVDLEDGGRRVSVNALYVKD